MILKIIRTEKPTADSVSIYFDRTDGLKEFKAGQHGLFSFVINGEEYKRTYSFHTAPFEREVGITVRTIENGVVSNHLQRENGSVKIIMHGIAGDFYVEPSEKTKRHLIMFAAGSGITPVFSMIKTVLHEEPASTISLVYSNKNYSTIIFKNELNTLQRNSPDRLIIYHVITQQDDIPADFPFFHKGRLSPLIVKKLINGILKDQSGAVEYYLCGPMMFMDMIANTILKLGVELSEIKKENFFIPSNKVDFDTTTLPEREIILQIDDEEKLIMVKGGQSILEAILQQGVKHRYSCTQGQCGTCKAKLLSGKIKHRKNHVLTEQELNEGQVILCQAFPFSDEIIIKTSM